MMNILPLSQYSLFSEHKLRNTVRQDPLLDFLALHGTRLGYVKDPEHYEKAGSTYDARMEFSHFIQRNRIQLCKHFVQHWLNILHELEVTVRERHEAEVQHGSGVSENAEIPESIHIEEQKRETLLRPLIVRQQVFLPRPKSKLLDWTTVPENVLKQKIVYIGARSNLVHPGNDSTNARSDSNPYQQDSHADPESPFLRDWYKNPHKEKFDRQTRFAMISAIPIIAGPLLMYKRKKCAAAPDFLIRSDLLIHLLEEYHDDLRNLALSPAPGLGLLTTHYVPIQVRFLSLHFGSSQNDENHTFRLKNVGNVAVYKTMGLYQSWVLEQVQGYRPRWSLLLGRSSMWTERQRDKHDQNILDDPEQDFEQNPDQDPEGLEVSDPSEETQSKSNTTEDFPTIFSAVHTAACIDCRDVPSEKFMIKCQHWIVESMQWWNWLESPASAELTLLGATPSDRRLLPNMKNQESFPWQFTKKELAKQFAEITQLWLCGYTLRQKCVQHRVYRLDDPRLVDLLPQFMKTPSKRRETLLTLLKHQISPEPSALVIPTKLTRQRHPWIGRPVRWFFDFETTESLEEDFSIWPYKSQKSYIAMIGSLIELDGQLRYRAFVTQHLTMDEEKRVIDEWMADCRQIGAQLGYPDIENPEHTAFIHWSQAEPKFLYTNRFGATRRHARRYSQDSEDPEDQSESKSSCPWPVLPMVDMMESIQNEPVCVKSAYNFKLKSFTKALFRHGLVDVDWPSGSQCDNGLSAMTALFLCDQDATAQNKTMLEIPLMKKIESYNRIDCLSMLKVAQFLQTHH